MGHAENKRNRIEQTELLLQFTPIGLTIFEIAEKIGCDSSTVHRYLKEIEGKRTLIEVSRGRYRLDPSQSLSNVRLHPSEALSIYLALRRFIRQTSKAPNFMISAIQKIAPALQRPDFIEMLSLSVQQLQEERLMSLGHTEIWKTILQGWLESTVIRISYQKAKETEITEYEIEPYWFEPGLGDATYLIAWSRRRGQLRTFKPDRIHRAVLTGISFQRRSEIDLLTLLRHTWGIWYGEEPTRVELLFIPRVASRVMETIYHPSEQKHLLEDGSLYWTVEVAGTLEILSWIRSWAHEVKVLAPESLRQQVIGDLREALVQYE